MRGSTHKYESPSVYTSVADCSNNTQHPRGASNSPRPHHPSLNGTTKLDEPIPFDFDLLVNKPGAGVNCRGGGRGWGLHERGTGLLPFRLRPFFSYARRLQPRPGGSRPPPAGPSPHAGCPSAARTGGPADGARLPPFPQRSAAAAASGAAASAASAAAARGCRRRSVGLVVAVEARQVIGVLRFHIWKKRLN